MRFGVMVAAADHVLFARMEIPIEKRPGRRKINVAAHHKNVGLRQGCFRKENHFLCSKLTRTGSRTAVLQSSTWR